MPTRAHAQAKVRKVLRQVESGHVAGRLATAGDAAMASLDSGLPGRAPSTVDKPDIAGVAQIVADLGWQWLADLSAEDVDR